MSNFGKVIIIVLGMHLLWGGTLYFRRGPIERDLTEHVNASLNLPEYSDVSVEFNGRTGTLVGNVKSPESIARAEKLARGYWGVRAIDNRLEVAADSSASNLSETRPVDVIQPINLAFVRGYQTNGKFLLSGEVPDGYTRNRIIFQAEEVFGPENLAIALRIDDDLTMPAGFMDSYRRFLDIHRFKSAGFELANGEFTLKEDLPKEFENYRPAKKRPSARMPVQPVSYQNHSAPTDATEVDREFRRLELKNILSAFVIKFDTSSVALTDKSRQMLDQAGQVLNRYSKINVEIQGHTDNSGTSEYNLLLSSARARTVYNYLIDAGIAAERLLAKGYGETLSIASNSTAEGRQHNRRVVFQAPEEK